MKDILSKYLNQDIRIKDPNSLEYHFYPLIAVSDNYLVINNPFDTKYHINNRYIPYTSIFQIIEQDSIITIELNNLDASINKIEENIVHIKEELFNVKGCIIGNSVPLGEIMRKLQSLDVDMVKEEQNSIKSIERDVSKLANSTRFYR